jgi:hypothetical protein
MEGDPEKKNMKSMQKQIVMSSNIVFFFYKFLIFNLTPNDCENRTFLKRHTCTPTFFIFSAKIALFFFRYLKILPKQKFGGMIKFHEILRKQHFFLHMNCLLQEEKKRKSVFASKKAVFQWSNTKTTVQKILGRGDDKN